MRQILFHIPLSAINSNWYDLPIYGYGMMLFAAFLACSWLAQRLCRRQGLNPSFIPDLAIWLFVAGIAGGRLVFVIQYWNGPGIGFAHRPFWDVFKLWDGGLVLYGALFGGAVGYFAYYYTVLKKNGYSNWKMFDVIAPCVVLGIALGRIGCLSTGCCYGNVACEEWRAIHFPLFSNSQPPQVTAPAADMIKRGHQTMYGFVLRADSFEVELVEPGTPAANAGLRAGDIIVAVNKKPVDVRSALAEREVELTVQREHDEVQLPAFTPATIGLHPTQIYETISMCLLLFFLLSYFPYRRYEGELLVFLLFGYGIHRFLNEMLRTDTAPVAFGLTLSQNVSIGILILGAILALIVYRRPPREETPPWTEAMTEVMPTMDPAPPSPTVQTGGPPQ
jgi:phosphatidylglycerol---prolipoprotein diacylglyceryl transferase